MAKFPTIDRDILSTTHGGYRWEKGCLSYNVEDRRPGAPSRPEQIRRTDVLNRANGCKTWSDLHPNQPLPRRW